mmetsp:Transcript_11409/g.25048  ORF Transcript_11409/g.25048 Transcript_11409/m.25048 type:complete len:361 (-) Transcript_11409:135-1217(-)
MRVRKERQLRRRRAATASALCLLSYSISIQDAVAFQPSLSGNTAGLSSAGSVGLPSHEVMAHGRNIMPPSLSTVSPSTASSRFRNSFTTQMAATPLDQQNDVTSSSSSSSDEVPSSADAENKGENQLPPLLQKMVDKVGKIDESRIVSTPEYLSGSVPKLFSNLHYETIQQTNSYGNETESVIKIVSSSAPSNTNFTSSSALLRVLTLPAAISSAGYLPTIVATLVAWAYMTISALLTSELLINRCGETGRVRNVGLLELYSSYLGDVGGKVAGVGFLIVSYVVMGVYLSEGGDHLMRLLELNDFSLAGGGDGASLLAGDSGAILSAASVSTSALPSMMGDLSTTISSNPASYSQEHSLP